MGRLPFELGTQRNANSTEEGWSKRDQITSRRGEGEPTWVRHPSPEKPPKRPVSRSSTPLSREHVPGETKSWVLTVKIRDSVDDLRQNQIVLQLRFSTGCTFSLPCSGDTKCVPCREHHLSTFENDRRILCVPSCRSWFLARLTLGYNKDYKTKNFRRYKNRDIKLHSIPDDKEPVVLCDRPSSS